MSFFCLSYGILFGSAETLSFAHSLDTILLFNSHESIENQKKLSRRKTKQLSETNSLEAPELSDDSYRKDKEAIKKLMQALNT